MKSQLFKDAVKRLSQYCKNSMIVYQEPDQNLSEVGRKYVHLRNINGNIAKYVIKDKIIIID